MPSTPICPAGPWPPLVAPLLAENPDGAVVVGIVSSMGTSTYGFGSANGSGSATPNRRLHLSHRLHHQDLHRNAHSQRPCWTAYWDMNAPAQKYMPQGITLPGFGGTPDHPEQSGHPHRGLAGQHPQLRSERGHRVQPHLAGICLHGEFGRPDPGPGIAVRIHQPGGVPGRAGRGDGLRAVLRVSPAGAHPDAPGHDQHHVPARVQPEPQSGANLAESRGLGSGLGQIHRSAGEPAGIERVHLLHGQRQ